MSSSATSIAKVTATITANAGALFTTSFAPASTAAPKAAVASILDPSHPNPVKFDTSDPLVLFIVQAFIIVGFSRLLGFFLGKLRQPKVISEVIAGIIIGPSALGRVPGFTSNIFPSQSISYLYLVANLGLVLFLFLVGLEVDFSLFRRDFKSSTSISFIGMIVPFGLGAAVGKGLYDNYIDANTVSFGTFILFIGTANAITAFPVLARILTELDLLKDPVGLSVLAAGVGNDVIGWVLLALAIALTNSTSGIIVLYIILCSIGWILALWFIARPVLIWWCRKTGAFGEKGPDETLVCGIVFLVLISAWVTDRIGIHSLFGGFVVGLIVPKELRGPLTEKIEDLVSVLFLPLRPDSQRDFSHSGLNTNLGLLADGSIWGWTFCVIFTAFLSKFISCGAVAKFNGQPWRESGAVGSLMACKGLVELIVLNIGHNAKILNDAVFAMFVLMALVTTFVTTPLTIAFYPMSYRLMKRGAITHPKDDSHDIPPTAGTVKPNSRYAVILQQFDHLPALFAFCKLIKAPVDISVTPASRSSIDKSSSPIGSASDEKQKEVEDVTSVAALRLIELTERTSAVLRASESPEALVAADSLTQVFKSHALGSGIPTEAKLEIAGAEQFPALVATHASEASADMLVLPWAIQQAKANDGGAADFIPNPFESIFGKSGSSGREVSTQYAAFVRKVFVESHCDVGLFLDRGLDSTRVFAGRAHLFFAFHGGSDDRACLDFIVQLATKNKGITATVVRITPAAEPTPDDVATRLTTRETSVTKEEMTPVLFSQLTVHGAATGTDTLYPTQQDLASDTADNIAFATWFEPSQTGARPQAVEDGLSRIEYIAASSIQPLHYAVAKAKDAARTDGVPLVVVSGRGRRNATSHTKELAAFLKENLEKVQSSIAHSSEVRRAIGDVAVAYLVAGVGSALVVIQSAATGGEVKNKSA
ncbi:potassium:hydrogen antiporter [Pseudohyphozyma bogoriensis]|nr:potassium:hydrogen antiporter [Pseudohyphozyma bogoriensis]